MKYDADMVTHRVTLASGILAALRDAGFVQIPNDGELVFERAHARAPSLRVRVYTSVVRDGAGFIARPTGEDAARAALVYVRKDGTEVGLVRAVRVNRTGQLDMIPDRLICRARQMYKEANTIAKGEKCCNICGAPLAVSKAKSLYCAALCWKG